MANLALRFPRFFLTSPAPCPYLPGRQERRLFTELRPGEGPAVYELLTRFGFRRSHTVAYRPSCEGCQACISVRVPVARFRASQGQRRAARANADLSVRVRPAVATPEQFALLKRYLIQRHPDGGMAAMDWEDFVDMVESTTVHTRMVEYRCPQGRLAGAAIVDRQGDGWSLIYSFFNPDERPGLGTAMIVEHISRAHAERLPFVYLGYWVPGSARMAYKARFRPLEALGPDGWRELPDPYASSKRS
jgi:arginine-tRNA-protein transferase